MLIVGELINASRKAIKESIKEKNTEEIRKVAIAEHEAGADFIDVNAGIFVGKEADYLRWLVQTVQEATDAPCCIDSPDPNAITAALEVHKGVAMINSISLEKERFDRLLPVISGTDLKVIALCMSDKGMPETSDQRLEIADKLINGLVNKNVSIDNIYVDPLVQPVGTNSSFGVEFLKAIEAIMTEFKGVHTMCGLSNISYGLPNRMFINQIFAVMAAAKGIDGLIINPLDKHMRANLIVADMLAGKDEFCMKYLNAFRNGMFES